MRCALLGLGRRIRGAAINLPSGHSAINRFNRAIPGVAVQPHGSYRQCRRDRAPNRARHQSALISCFRSVSSRPTRPQRSPTPARQEATALPIRCCVDHPLSCSLVKSWLQRSSRAGAAADRLNRRWREPGLEPPARAQVPQPWAQRQAPRPWEQRRAPQP